MISGLDVAALDRAGQGEDGVPGHSAQLVLGALELRDGLGEERRSIVHGLLEPLLVLPALPLQPRADQRVGHGDQHLVGVVRLADPAVCSELERAGGRVDPFDAGDHHHGKDGELGADVLEQGDPRLARHAHVGEHQVRPHELEQAARLARIGGEMADVPVSLEDPAEDAPSLLVVVHDEDVGRRGIRLREPVRLIHACRPGRCCTSSSSRTLSSSCDSENGFSSKVTPASSVPVDPRIGCA